MNETERDISRLEDKVSVHDNNFSIIERVLNDLLSVLQSVSDSDIVWQKLRVIQHELNKLDTL